MAGEPGGWRESKWTASATKCPPALWTETTDGTHRLRWLGLATAETLGQDWRIGSGQTRAWARGPERHALPHPGQKGQRAP